MCFIAHQFNVLFFAPTKYGRPTITDVQNVTRISKSDGCHGLKRCLLRDGFPMCSAVCNDTYLRYSLRQWVLGYKMDSKIVDFQGSQTQRPVLTVAAYLLQMINY